MVTTDKGLCGGLALTQGVGHVAIHAQNLSRLQIVGMLLEQFRVDVEAAVMEGRLGYEESGRLLKFYEEGLYGYTYLEDTHRS